MISAASRNSSSTEALNEPHSTKQIEDCIAWASETSAETMIDTVLRALLEPAR